MYNIFSTPATNLKIILKIAFAIVLKLHLISETNCCLRNSGTENSKAWTPVPKSDYWWQTMHENFVTNTKNNSRRIKILFYGDSITQAWNEDGNSTFYKYYYKVGAANYGISGDRTEHLLWRIQNGEIGNKLRPKVIILMIGTNNLGVNSDSEISKGVSTIVKTLRRKLPLSKILLLGILPRSNGEVTHRVNLLNKRLMLLDDGIMTWYFDMGKYFYVEDRLIRELYHPDLLHLSSKGYAMWAAVMELTLKEMLEFTFQD